MFSLLRAALVIGAIFYFSPVRQEQDSGLSLEALVGAATHSSETLTGVAPERLQAAWNALPESARQAVLDKIVPTAPRPGGTARPPQTDTLLPEDHHPAWTGASKKPGA
jgi:hypothetical protein